MHHQSNGAASILVLAVLVVIVVLRRRGVRQTPSGTLKSGERQRPVLITFLDPVISIAFIGTVLWGLMTRSVGHTGMAVAGGLIGIPFGILRARAMYVRSVRASKSVILRRSPLEYGLVAILIALRLAENSIANLHDTLATYLLTAMIAFAVVESIARAASIVWRYYHEPPTVEAAA